MDLAFDETLFNKIIVVLVVAIVIIGAVAALQFSGLLGGELGYLNDLYSFGLKGHLRSCFGLEKVCRYGGEVQFCKVLGGKPFVGGDEENIVCLNFM